MNALSGLVVRRPWWVVVGWIAAIALIQVVSSAVGGATYKDDFKLPGTESQTVSDLLSKAKLSQQNNPTGTLVLRARNGTLAAEPAGFIAKAAAAVCHDEAAHIATITTPWGSAACAAGDSDEVDGARPDLLSPDKTVALVEVGFDLARPDDNAPKAVYDDLRILRSENLEIEFTGDSFTGVGATPAVSPELLGFIAALLILAIVFRTLGATVLPLLSAAAGLGSGLGLIAILSHGMSVASFAPSLAELMVIGVGVDYALFIVTRHRRNLRAGMSVEESIRRALDTAGRAVLFAGMTVCIAILGLCALGVSFLYGVAIGTSIGVALTMLASLTLLPALLALLGRRALPRSQREALPSDKRVKVVLCVVPPLCVLFWVLYGVQWALRSLSARLVARPSAGSRAPLWTSWANLVQRRYLAFGVVAVVILVVVALPFFSLRLGHADQSNDQAGSTTRKGYDLIQRAFGEGYNSTLQLVVDGPLAADKGYLDKVTHRLGAVDDVDPASITAIPATKDVALVAFKSTSGPQDVETDELVKTLRDDALPPVYKGTSTKIYVYGTTAVFIDFSEVLSAKMALFILAVVGLSFLLLMAAFRSLVIPLTAAAMNLLAAGASFGIVVAIFQWGWLGDAIGAGAGGPIEAFLPVLFFAILFGLSMDYQVFLVSRMHEEWVRTADNHRAVTVGQAETGGIITAAALIMIAVFAGFVLDADRGIKLLGVGLASAVFLDAFVVRTMLVPALMHRIGPANWWYPGWLQKITPHVSIESPDEAVRSADSADDRELVAET
jgi:RND superfamily putative drug exporter